jgi:hypothetical protein
MTDEELIARLRLPWPKDGSGDEVTLPLWVLILTAEAADRIEALLNLNEALVELMDDRDAKLAQATWLLTEAAVQLEEGKIKTRRNRAAIIWNLLDEMKDEIEGENG